jgi:hypothetical protein
MLRRGIIADVPEPSVRRALLEQLAGEESFEIFAEKGPDVWRQRAEKIIKAYTTPAHEL